MINENLVPEDIENDIDFESKARKLAIVIGRAFDFEANSVYRCLLVLKGQGMRVLNSLILMTEYVEYGDSHKFNVEEWEQYRHEMKHTLESK